MKRLARDSIKKHFKANSHLSGILLFDGYCKFCSMGMRTLQKLDKHKKFDSIPVNDLDVDEGYLEMNDVPNDLTSMVLIYLGKDGEPLFLRKSSAIIHTCVLLGFPYSLAASLYIIPKFLRDKAYNFMAVNRYKIMGKYETLECNDLYCEYKFKTMGKEE